MLTQPIWQDIVVLFVSIGSQNSATGLFLQEKRGLFLQEASEQFLQESLKRGKPKEKSAEMLAKEATKAIKDKGRDLVAQRMSNTFSRGVMMSPKNG